jgi:hypothetical protein
MMNYAGHNTFTAQEKIPLVPARRPLTGALAVAVGRFILGSLVAGVRAFVSAFVSAFECGGHRQRRLEPSSKKHL